MKIERCEVWTTRIPLKEPFTIAYDTTTEIDLAILQISTVEGFEGLGVAAPFKAVTGESFDATEAALINGLTDELAGQEMTTPELLQAVM